MILSWLKTFHTVIIIITCNVFTLTILIEALAKSQFNLLSDPSLVHTGVTNDAMEH